MHRCGTLQEAAAGVPCEVRDGRVCCPKPCPRGQVWIGGGSAQPAGAACEPRVDGRGFCCDRRVAPPRKLNDIAGAAFAAHPRLAEVRHLPAVDPDAVIDIGYGLARYTDVLSDGNCFYDSLARIIESGRRQNLSVLTLRYQIAKQITARNIEEYRKAVATDRGNPEYRQLSLSQMWESAVSSDHWATSSDITMAYRSEHLDVIPIVLNGAPGEHEGSIIAAYCAPANRWGNQPKANRRYAILFNNGNHYEPVVRRDLWYEIDGVPYFGALFSEDEVPAPIRVAFFRTLQDHDHCTV